jgi:hypothetical protein
MMCGVGSYACAAPVIGPLREEPPAAFLLGGMVVFTWALGWDSAIRRSADYLSITNFLVTSTVAWSDVDEVAVHDGLTVTLRDGRTIDSVAFGGSLLVPDTPKGPPAASRDPSHGAPGTRRQGQGPRPA